MSKRQTKGEWLRARVGHNSDECLIWPFHRFPNGYGQLGVTGDGSYTRYLYAHRYMCEIAHGPAPHNHEAAHSCNNRSCVNPRHLSWKTKPDNQADRIVHGTNHHPGHKLKRTQLDEIRALKGKLTQREIAQLYGVTFQSVSVVHRKANNQKGIP